MNNNIEWKMVKLGDLCNIRMGQSPEGQYYNDKQIGLPLVQGNADIENRKTIVRSYTSYITKTCDNGEYILSVRAPVGAIAKATFKACIGRGVCAFSYPNEYLYQYFIFIENQWAKLSTGSTFDSINGPTLRNVKIPIPYKNGSPDLETQELIAKKLGDMDSLIASKEKLLAKKRNLKTAAMQKLIKDEESENWRKVKLGDVIQYLRTGLNPRDNFKLNTEDCYGYYITVRELKGFRIVTDEKTDRINNDAILKINKRSKIQINDVLISGTGTIGQTALVTEMPDNWGVKEGIYIITPKMNKLDSRFLIYYFQNPTTVALLEFMASGSTIKSVPMENLKDLLFPIPFTSDGNPDLAEQKRIATILSDMDTEISSIENEITKLRNLKTAMMQKMFKFEEVVE